MPEIWYPTDSVRCGSSKSGIRCIKEPDHKGLHYEPSVGAWATTQSLCHTALVGIVGELRVLTDGELLRRRQLMADELEASVMHLETLLIRELRITAAG